MSCNSFIYYLNLDDVSIWHLIVGLSVSYLFIGYQIADRSWKMWTVRGTNSRILALFLFPRAMCSDGLWKEEELCFVTGSTLEKSRSIIAHALSSGYKKKVTYYFWTSVLWPCKMLPNLLYMIWLVLYAIWFWLIPEDRI